MKSLSLRGLIYDECIRIMNMYLSQCRQSNLFDKVLYILLPHDWLSVCLSLHFKISISIVSAWIETQCKVFYQSMWSVCVCMWIFIWFSLYACKIFVNLKFPQQFNLLVMIEILWEDFLSLSLCVANKSFRVRFCFELNFWIFKSI